MLDTHLNLANTPNVWKLRRRRIKAAALSAVLSNAGITREMAVRMNDREWSLAASCAQVNPPSSQTRRAVIARIGRQAWISEAALGLGRRIA